MSAFGFINNKNNKSPMLSPSLIEDLYDSQQLNTFVNQSRTSSPHSQRSFSKLPSKTSKPISSFFSFIDDLDSPPPKRSIKRQSSDTSSTTSNTSSPPDRLRKSAFAFIANAPATKTDSIISEQDSSRRMTESYLSPQTERSFIKPNNEMKLISAKTSLQRIQTEKSNELNQLERLYKKQLQIYDQISTLKSEITLVQQQKETALTKEDFLLAETLQTQEQKMSTSLSDLTSQTLLQEHIYSSWKKIRELQEKEDVAAKNMIKCCQQVKEERHLHYMKFITDNEKLHEQKLKDIDQQRNVIESEKSEIAFDFGLWEQNQQDFIERQDDAIQEQVRTKKNLEEQTKQIQIEIKELQEKLKSLEIKKSEYLANTVEIDLAIEEKLKPFENEKLEQEQEYETIDIRRKEIEIKSNNLNELETQLDLEMNRHLEEKERGLKEIRALDQHIILTTESTQQHESLVYLLNKIQHRDELVTQHTSYLQRLIANIQSKKKSIDASRYILYDKHQKDIILDETILELQQKLKSLARHKQLAIDAGRFQNAAAWSNQIKLTEKELSKQTLDQQQQQTDTVHQQDSLNKQQEELHALQQEYSHLEKQRNAEVKLILETFRDELLDTKTNDKVIQSMIQHELNSVSVQLQQHDLVSHFL